MGIINQALKAGIGSSDISLADALTHKPVAEGLWYNQKEMTLDGYHFKRCRFDQCKLTIATPDFILDHCLIDAETVLIFGPALIKVVQLFNSRLNGYAPQAPFLPKQHADGTISIGL